MRREKRHIGVAALFGLATLFGGGLPPEAQGQSPLYQIRPGLTIGQYAYNLALLGQALAVPYAYQAALTNPYLGSAGLGAYSSLYSTPSNAYASPYSNSYNSYASLYANPYNSYANPYTNPSNSYGNPSGSYYPSYDPSSEYVRAAANATTAQGQLMVSQQQAFQMREKVRSARLDNRKKAFDEYLYEREKTPTPEEERQRYGWQQVLRSRSNPPVTEVWSGQALNALLDDLKKQVGRPESANLRTFAIPLDEDGLKHINVTTGANAGNLGMLKNAGRLNWPVALGGNEFRDERERINALAQEAVKQAEFNNQVDAGTVRQLASDVDHVHQQLRRVGSGLSFDEYREAKTFLNNLSDAVKALRQPDVGNYFNGRQVLADVKTVPQLVQRMADAGLTFAPAVAGQESAYRALHQALAAYDLATHAKATP